jgi:hypothetical protein
LFAVARTTAAQDDIQVHGHWTIDVRDPDGALVSHHEFKNALVANEGADTLNKLLGRRYVIADWSIVLGAYGGPGTQSPCVGAFQCFILEPRYAGAGDASREFANLAITTPTTGPNAGKLVLSGTATVTNTEPQSAIQYVMTSVTMCPITSLANTPCGPASIGNRFTAKDLDAPVILRPGQIVQVSVVYSFSSGL